MILNKIQQIQIIHIMVLKWKCTGIMDPASVLMFRATEILSDACMQILWHQVIRGIGSSTYIVIVLFFY